MNRFTAPAIALFSLSLAACVVGEIEGPPGSSTRRRDSGSASGNGNSGDDLPDPPPDDEPAPPPPSDDDAGSTPQPDTAPPPPSSDAGGGGAPPPPAVDGAPPPPSSGEYPSGPYGVDVGSVVPNVSLSGYRLGGGTYGPIKMSEYYDPTGARGVRGMLVTVSAAWCGPCREEAKDLVAMFPGYKARGGRFLTAMIENSSRAPATQSTIDGWVSTFGTNFDIVADPSAQLLKSGGGLPSNFVVDTRTMKITKTWSGSDPGMTSVPSLDSVITKNGG